MAQQTAVEWFIEQLPIRIVNMYHKEIEQAKQMEKEQIIKAYNTYYSQEAFIDGEYLKGEQYYNQTYNK